MLYMLLVNFPILCPKLGTKWINSQDNDRFDKSMCIYRHRTSYTSLNFEIIEYHIMHVGSYSASKYLILILRLLKQKLICLSVSTAGLDIANRRISSH